MFFDDMVNRRDNGLSQIAIPCTPTEQLKRHGDRIVSNLEHRKSLFNPPPPPSWILLVSNTFEGSGIYLGGEGAYLIYRTWWYQVSIRIRLQSGKAQVQDVGFHAPGIKNKSELPARELVQMKFYGVD